MTSFHPPVQSGMSLTQCHVKLKGYTRADTVPRWGSISGCICNISLETRRPTHWFYDLNINRHETKFIVAAHEGSSVFFIFENNMMLQYADDSLQMVSHSWVKMWRCGCALVPHQYDSHQSLSGCSSRCHATKNKQNWWTPYLNTAVFSH